MGDIATALERHRMVGVDSSVFIYHLEDSARYSPVTTQALTSLANGNFNGVTSTITLMELAVRPIQQGRPDIADTYNILLANFPHLLIEPVDQSAARLAAELRAIHRLRPADALQIGSCIQAGATAFLTNDKTLRRVTEIEVIILDDFVPAE